MHYPDVTDNISNIATWVEHVVGLSGFSTHTKLLVYILIQYKVMTQKVFCSLSAVSRPSGLDQNLISYSSCQGGCSCIRKLKYVRDHCWRRKTKYVHQFLRYVGNRRTNRQTDRQIDRQTQVKTLFPARKAGNKNVL